MYNKEYLLDDVEVQRATSERERAGESYQWPSES